MIAYQLLLAAIIIFFILLITFVLFSPFKCFLDVLNYTIAEQTVFKPFYDVKSIPELQYVEDAYLDICEEMEAILPDIDNIPTMHDVYNNMVDNGKGRSTIVKKLNKIAERLIYGPDTDIFNKINTPDWQTFNLIIFNQEVPENASRCPKTVEALKRVPGMQSCLFSIMGPGAYVPPHSDPGKGVIRYHLGLKVPKDRDKCFICVDGIKYHWKEGEGVLFDDVFEHWVQNDTDETRVILFVDILRPLTGMAKYLQSLANFANQYHPGVKKAIKAAVVKKVN